MNNLTLLSLLAALLLATIHLIAGKLRFLEGTPRSIWLSVAGGISVAYVFLHLLPELAEGQEVLQRSVQGLVQRLEHHAYLVGLLGLTVFYGLERLAKASRETERQTSGEDVTSPGVFWLHMGSFAIYNILIGYLLVDDTQTTRELLFFAVAMALHFLVNDYGLREHHKALYTRIGRWLLAPAVLAGWALGQAVDIPELATTVLAAFIAGGVVLNVLKEELPEERRSRFSAFLLGSGAYAALLLAL